MTEIQYVIGDATEPLGDGTKIIVHCCNNIGGWGRGFVLALSAKWEEPEKAYRMWASKHNPYKTAPFSLGSVILVKTEVDIYVANMIGQEGMYPVNGIAPIRYAAFEEGLGDIAFRAEQLKATVHMPRIGCGLAGGDWSRVEQIINETLIADGIPVTVYDLK